MERGRERCQGKEGGSGDRQSRGRMGERRPKGATKSGRIERPKLLTTAAGESVHDAETGSQSRENRDNRRTSQGAAIARGLVRKGTAFVARTCPTKSTVFQPHFSSVSRVPITYGRHTCLRRRAGSCGCRCSIGALHSPRTTRELRTVLAYAVSSLECPCAGL